MHFPTLFAVFASACAASLGDRTACDPYPSNAELAASRTALVKAKLVPDTAAQFRTSGSDVNLIPTFNPTVLVDVAYGTEAASFGNALSTLETLSEPSISFSAEKGYDPYTTKYTIIMLDPDAPSPAAPLPGSFSHLIISDAQPGCVINQLRKEVASYMSPIPASISPHRYTFLVYRQPKGYVPPVQLSNLPVLRGGFNVTQYALENGLQGPVAGNFFREGL